MKRKPIIVALALLLVVGAALCGVNYRLNHPPIPPLSEADVVFQLSVQKADCVWVEASDRTFPPGRITLAVLKGEKYRKFMNQLRFVRYSRANNEMIDHVGIAFKLKFFHGDHAVKNMTLWQTSTIIEVDNYLGRSQDDAHQIYELHPQLVRPLNRTLDAYLPQRIRP